LALLAPRGPVPGDPLRRSTPPRASRAAPPCPPPTPPPLTPPPSSAQIMVLSTTLCLAAGRFGLAPTSTRHTTAGLKLYDDKSAGLMSGDPAGFTAVDVLALGAFGHALGAGIVLGLKGTGAL
jgi:photosystem I subunit 10